MQALEFLFACAKYMWYCCLWIEAIISQMLNINACDSVSHAEESSIKKRAKAKSELHQVFWSLSLCHMTGCFLKKLYKILLACYNNKIFWISIQSIRQEKLLLFWADWGCALHLPDGKLQTELLFKAAAGCARYLLITSEALHHWIIKCYKLKYVQFKLEQN